MIPEAYIVVGSFVVFVLFFIIMSFASKYYIDLQSRGLGRWVNFAWMVIIIIVFGILLTFNVTCTINGNCRYMSILIAALVVGITLMNIIWGIYQTVNFKKQPINKGQKTT